MHNNIKIAYFGIIIYVNIKKKLTQKSKEDEIKKNVKANV